MEYFSDKLMEFTWNRQQSPDPTTKMADFQEEIAAAYEVLLSN